MPTTGDKRQRDDEDDEGSDPLRSAIEDEPAVDEDANDEESQGKVAMAAKVARLNRVIRDINHENDRKYAEAMTRVNEARALLLQLPAEVPAKVKEAIALLAFADAVPAESMRIAAPIEREQINKGDFPFRFVQLYASTETITEETRIPTNGPRFVHVVGPKKSTGKDLALLVEAVNAQDVAVQLVDRKTLEKRTEHDLAAYFRVRDAHPEKRFKLHLCLANTGNRVTKQCLDTDRVHKTDLCDPPGLLSQTALAMVDGKVHFRIRHLHVYSSDTSPRDQEFVYKIEPDDAELRKEATMNFTTKPFYIVSRSATARGEGQAKKGKDAAHTNAASAATNA